MRNTYHLFLALILLSAFTSVQAETASKTPIRWGILSGWVNGDVGVTNDPSRVYTNGYGLGPTLGVFAEKSVTPLFAVTANVEFVNSWSPDFLSDSPSSFGYFASIGGVLGRVGQPKSTYLSFAYGYSVVDIDDVGDPNREACTGLCFINLTPRYTRGGRGDGTGYRVAIGRTFKTQARFEIAYSMLTGKGSDFPANSQAEFVSWQAVLRILRK